MIYLQLILFIIVIGLSAYSRVMISKYHAVFYNKGRRKDPTDNLKIEKWKNNIHILANQAYRTIFGGLLCVSLIVLMPYFGWWSILYSLGIVILASASVTQEWQKWINLSLGFSEVDPNEKPTHEYIIFGKSFWLSKFWYKERRVWISQISFYSLIILLGFIITKIL